MSLKTYSELSKIELFEDRFKYLQLNGQVGKDTFGFDRIFNQMFYASREWRLVRDRIIVRDNGCDLGCPDHEIPKHQRIFIHHLNPISVDDIGKRTELLLNPEYLITTTFETHNAIHYGDESLLIKAPTERTKNDTCPWRHD